MPRGQRPGTPTNTSQPSGWLFRWAFRSVLRLVRAAVTLCAATSFLAATPAIAVTEFLPAEQAFRLEVRRLAADRAELRFDIAPGYYLYRAPLAVQAEGARIGPLAVPPGVVRFDENFQKEVETYEHRLEVGVPLEEVSGPVILVVQSQGCAEAGLCYPLATTRVRLPDQPGALATAAPPAALATNPAASGGAGRSEVARAPADLPRWAWPGLGLAAAAVIVVLAWRRQTRRD